jgi:O-antigen/teichoic acid export membrane protein
MNRESTLFEKFKETGKHGLIYGLGSVIQQFASFFLLPLYTTRFSPSDYGILGLVTATESIIAVVFAFGINYGMLRSYYDYDDDEGKKTVISTSFLMVFISCAILLIAGISLSNTLSLIFFKTSNYRIHFILMTLIAVFEILNIVPIVVLRAKMKSLQYIFFQVLIFIIGVGVIIYLVNVRKWNILGPLTGQVIMGALTCFVFYFIIRKEFVFKFSKEEVKKMLLLGLPLIPGNLGAFVFNSIDRYFLNHYSNTTQLGLYNLAYNFSSVLSLLLATPIALIWPIMYLSVMYHKNAKEFYARALTYSLAISMFLFLGLALLSKEAIKIFSNPAYLGAYAVIPLIVLTYAFWATRKIINVAVTIKRKTIFTAISEVSGAVINIGLNFLLIPRYGIMGAAYATFISFIVVIGMMLYYNQKLIKLDYEIVRIIKIFAVTAVIFSAGYFIVFENLVISIIFKVIIVLLFPLLLAVLKFYYPNEIVRAKSTMRSAVEKLKRKRRDPKE